MERVIIATMRDEAATLIEWLAHHLATGFDGFYICTNDCTDGTDQILNLLSAHFPIIHQDNPPPYGEETIQFHALRRAKENEVVNKAQWALHIDADEYVNVTIGDHKIQDLIELHPEAEAIAIAWRYFGNSNISHWAGGRTLDQFTWAADTPDLGFKTMMRPARFKRFSIHMPKFPLSGNDAVVVNSVGRAMPIDRMMRPRGTSYVIEDQSLVTWENACLHHYHVRPDNMYRAKTKRGDANGRSLRKRKVDGDYYKSANRNDVEDLSIGYNRELAMEIEAKMRAVAGVSELEEKAVSAIAKL